jgi:NADPH:quinone reductase-like Zn-dependent oxidoreductase
MKAIVYHAPRDFSYQEVPDPQVGPDEVPIRALLPRHTASTVRCFTWKAAW